MLGARDVQHTVDRARSQRELDHPLGHHPDVQQWRHRPRRDHSARAFLDPALDRVMVCGSPAMLEDTRALLDGRGFNISPHIGEPGDYVIERAFVER